MAKNDSGKNLIYKIAAEISNNDAAVLEEINECLSDIKKYFAENVELYKERGITRDDMENGEENFIQWIGMVDILFKHHYACERDWKDELEDFLYFMRELEGVKSNHLTLEEDWFDEGDDVAKWCGIIDRKWAPLGMCAAAIDIDSDSYVIFPCNINVLQKLQEYTGETDFGIGRASRM